VPVPENGIAYAKVRKIKDKEEADTFVLYHGGVARRRVVIDRKNGTEVRGFGPGSSGMPIVQGGYVVGFWTHKIWNEDRVFGTVVDSENEIEVWFSDALMSRSSKLVACAAETEDKRTMANKFMATALERKSLIANDAMANFAAKYAVAAEVVKQHKAADKVLGPDWIANSADLSEENIRVTNMAMKELFKKVRKATGWAAPEGAVRTTLDIDVADMAHGTNQLVTDVARKMLMDMRTESKYGGERASTDDAGKAARRAEHVNIINRIIIEYTNSGEIPYGLIPTKERAGRPVFLDFISSYIKQTGRDPDGLPAVIGDWDTKALIAEAKTRKAPDGTSTHAVQEANIDRMTMMVIVAEEIKLAGHTGLRTARALMTLLASKTVLNKEKARAALSKGPVGQAFLDKFAATLSIGDKEKYMCVNAVTIKRLVSFGAILNSYVQAPIQIITITPRQDCMKFITGLKIAEDEDFAGEVDPVYQSHALLYKFIVGEMPDVYTGLKKGNALDVSVKLLNQKKK
jgi:hypothetical protein